ncbi:MAG: hypothetical protein GF353_15585 [Candidatus Lokiarchaeota archaeon]|nr:hypothetical protein [Candidatus Lokiarchaeota archaeon]
MEKWLKGDSSKKKKTVNLEEISEEKIKELKIKKIRTLIGEKKETEKEKEKDKEAASEEDEFLNLLISFRDWLIKRRYLKGDIDKIAIWINNLNDKLISMTKKNREINDEAIKKSLKDNFKEIPPKFLDEKTRIALNKVLHKRKRNASDTYYLTKLKKEIQKRLREDRYYRILEKVLEIK